MSIKRTLSRSLICLVSLYGFGRHKERLSLSQVERAFLCDDTGRALYKFAPISATHRLTYLIRGDRGSWERMIIPYTVAYARAQ